MKEHLISFEPSNVHQGHYVCVDGEHTGIVINLFAYKTIEEYKKETDQKIRQWTKQKH